MTAPSVLRVEILSGHASPWVGEFAKPEVLIGRGLSCDVRLHPTLDTLAASNVHARLVWTAQDVEVICEHANGVSISWFSGAAQFLEKGQRVSVQSAFEIEIARNGPRLRIQRVASVLPGTLKPDSPEAKKKKFQPVGRIAGETVAAARTGRRIAIAGVTLLLLACAVGGAWAWRYEQSLAEIRRQRNAEIDRLVAEQAIIRREVEQRPPGDALRTALTAAAGSVFLVGLERAGEGFVPLGTAWTAAQGKLATNAHVAQGLQTGQKSGSRAIARRTGPAGEPLDIYAIDIHPAFEQWTEILSQQSVRTGSREAEANLVAVGDVAILTLSGGDSGAALPMAAADDPISPGDPVGYIGFPMEGISAVPTRQTVIGHITAATDPFFEEARGASALLVHMNAPGAGGASGSPIINERGRVIAMLSAGSMIALDAGSRTARVPTGFTYGQSVVLIREMLDQSAARAQQERDRTWQAAMAARFVAPEDRLNTRTRELETTLKATAERLSDEVLLLPAAGDLPAKPLRAEPGYHYLLLAASADWSPLTLAAGAGGKAEAFGRTDRGVVALVLKKSDTPRSVDLALRAARPLRADAKVHLRIARVRD